MQLSIRYLCSLVLSESKHIIYRNNKLKAKKVKQIIFITKDKKTMKKICVKLSTQLE